MNKVQLIVDSLHDQPKDSPVTTAQAIAITVQLATVRAALVSVMDTLAALTEQVNESHMNTNENFFGLLAVCKRLGYELGIDVTGTNEAVNTDNVTKH